MSNDPCFEWRLGLLLEGSNPKMDDKQVPGTFVFSFLYICT